MPRFRLGARQGSHPNLPAPVLTRDGQVAAVDDPQALATESVLPKIAEARVQFWSTASQVDCCE